MHDCLFLFVSFVCYIIFLASCSAETDVPLRFILAFGISPYDHPTNLQPYSPQLSAIKIGLTPDILYVNNLVLLVLYN